MAVIPVSPLFLKDSVIEVAGSDHRMAVSSVTLTPTTPTVTFTGMSPAAVYTDTGNTTWTVTLVFANDYVTAGSLANYLFDNVGKKVAFVFRPTSNIGPSFKCDVIVQPAPIGGAQGAASTATVTLGITGVPVRVAAV